MNLLIYKTTKIYQPILFSFKYLKNVECLHRIFKDKNYALRVFKIFIIEFE